MPLNLESCPGALVDICPTLPGDLDRSAVAIATPEVAPAEVVFFSCAPELSARPTISLSEMLPPLPFVEDTSGADEYVLPWSGSTYGVLLFSRTRLFSSRSRRRY